MVKATSVIPSGDAFTVEPYKVDRSGLPHTGRTFLLQVKDDAISNMLLASLSLLDRLMVEKTAAVRERRLEEMVDFMTERMLVPSAVELDMAQRLAIRHARVLNEFGYFSAEDIAAANRSTSVNRNAMADNWRKRRQIFAVPHPDKTARDREVYPAFQFNENKPIKAIQAVLDAFSGRKTSWKLALWFTSNNGWLPDSARPVDLLTSDPKLVIEAAQRDEQGSAI